VLCFYNNFVKQSILQKYRLTFELDNNNKALM